VIGLLVVQALGGLYMLTFTADAGMAESNARATRLPDPALLIHPLFGLIGVVLWLVWLEVDDKGFAWATLVSLVLGTAVGAFLGHRTLAPAPDPVSVSPGDPAAARYAEKRIPLLALAAHGGLALLILLLVLLVCLGVG
jgi:hypothetical protein